MNEKKTGWSTTRRAEDLAAAALTDKRYNDQVRAAARLRKLSKDLRK